MKTLYDLTILQSAGVILLAMLLVGSFLILIFSLHTDDMDIELQKLARKLNEMNRQDTNAGIKLGERIFAIDRQRLNTGQFYLHKNLIQNFCRKFPELQPTELIK
jgi:hypothetical protein